MDWSNWWITFLLASILGFGGWWLWWQLPKRQADSLRLTDPKARADVEDSFRKTIGQLLGGAAVLVGAGFAYLQFRQQQRSAHELLISNQVSKGFEHLSSEQNGVLRLGGIYALEGVMNTSEQYHQPVLEALCAFVRRPSNTERSDGNGPLAADTQAALAVIGRRTTDWPDSLDLGGAGIPRARLDKANLSGANLDKANLSGANLEAANLSGANLSGADLQKANLLGANLQDANLTSANLTSANMNVASLRYAKLMKADLISATLGEANLTSADLSDANLSDAYLYRANLSGANLSRANLSGTDLKNVGLSDAYLGEANLSGADLRGAHLIQAQLDRACGSTDTKLPKGLTLKSGTVCWHQN